METKMIKGVPTTRDQAVINNLGLAKKIAAKYEERAKKVGFDFEDLVSYGSIGLMKAFDDFDDKKGFQFSTYATHKIIGEVTLAIRLGSDGALRYPANIKDCAMSIMTKDLFHESVQNIAKQLKVSEFFVKQALEYLKGNERISLDFELSEDGRKVHELIGSEQDDSQVFIQDFLQTLTEKERVVAELLLKGYGPKDIGIFTGYSRGYVGIYKPGIRKKLKEYMSEEMIS